MCCRFDHAGRLVGRMDCQMHHRKTAGVPRGYLAVWTISATALICKRVWQAISAFVTDSRHRA
ncbi:hypothetical protein KCP73_02450 [Salmonella enterica subsp. enterica]|nr:hypothetical protein KCP73_02450 [Salmonella enterica subsp. enterica]